MVLDCGLKHGYATNAATASSQETAFKRELGQGRKEWKIPLAGLGYQNP